MVMLQPSGEIMLPRPARAAATLIEVMQVSQGPKYHNPALTLDSDLLHGPTIQLICHEAPPYLGAEDHQEIRRNPLPNMS